MNHNQPILPVINPVALAFRQAFIRALEQWTFDLRKQNDNRRYHVALARNDYCCGNGFSNYSWPTKP